MNNERCRVVLAIFLFLAGIPHAFGQGVDVLSVGSDTEQYSYTDRGSTSDVDLLARLIEAEAAGEPQSGKVAIAAVVLNRTRSPRYPPSSRAVVNDHRNGCQFTPVCTGYLWKVTPSASSYSAARAALSGQ